MNREFDFIDLYRLSVFNETKNNEPQNAEKKEASDVFIEISDSENTDAVAYTYAKFLEVLEKEGLEGLINT